MKRWSLDTMAKCLGGGVRQIVRDFEMLAALQGTTGDDADAQDWEFAPRRFTELTNGELRLLATGLSKDRMYGAWMAPSKLERSKRLQDEMETELERREDEER